MNIGNLPGDFNTEVKVYSPLDSISLIDLLYCSNVSGFDTWERMYIVFFAMLWRRSSQPRQVYNARCNNVVHLYSRME